LGQMLSAVTYKSNWWGFIGKRVLIALVAFLFISFIFFTLAELPSDLLGANYISVSPLVTREMIETKISEYHLNDSIAMRYWYWVIDFFEGSLGNSSIFQMPAED
jgi:ABC-type dipeptide/oligopeptide/nickel transport system permease component